MTPSKGPLATSEIPSFILKNALQNILCFSTLVLQMKHSNLVININPPRSLVSDPLKKRDSVSLTHDKMLFLEVVLGLGQGRTCEQVWQPLTG